MKKFAIVDFEGEQGPETSIVPSTWIEMEKGQCYWPDQSDLKRAVIDCLAPRESWSLYPFKGIKYETDEYPKAAEKLKLLLQGFSDIGSHSEDGHHGNRRKRMVHKKRCVSSSDSDDDQAAFSSQPPKRSRVDENARLQRLPTLESTQPFSTELWATALLRNMQPTPEPEPLRARSRTARSPYMRTRPATSSTSMHTFDDFSDHYSSEDQTDFGFGSVNFTNILLNRLISKLEEQSEVLQNVAHKLNQITLLLQNVGEEVIGTALMPDGLSLPLTNEQEIERLEEKLMEKGFRAKLVTLLSCVRGDSVIFLVRRMLKRLFSSELALKFNFVGMKGKKSFQSLQLRNVIIAAVRKTCSTSEAEVNGIARNWFRNARDMCGGRKRRAMSYKGIPSLMG